jgi:hypothetical protein
MESLFWYDYTDVSVELDTVNFEVEDRIILSMEGAKSAKF